MLHYSIWGAASLPHYTDAGPEEGTLHEHIYIPDGAALLHPRRAASQSSSLTFYWFDITDIPARCSKKACTAGRQLPV